MESDAANNFQPVSAPVTPEQPAKPPRRWFLPAILALAVIVLGAASYFLWRTYFQSKAEDKKDVSLLRWVQPEKGLDAIYPNINNDSIKLEVNRQIFEGLVGYEGLTNIAPRLATSWTNPDDSTWVFTLAKNVKFHTGRTMTAEDVKASLDAVKDTELGDLFASTIESVEVTSDNKIKITTDGPDPVLLNKLTYLFIFDAKGKENDPANGTGPYQLKPGTKPSESEINLVAFDDYHGGHVYTRELQIKYSAREDEAGLFNANKADVASVGSVSYAKDVTRKYDQLEAPSPSVSLLGLNNNRAGSPLGNKDVREAVYLATDVAALLKVRQQEGTAIGQLVPQEIPGYNSAITRPSRNVSKAKQLLSDAGYPNGITLQFTYFSAAQSTAEEIARELKEAGITLTLDPQTDVSVLGKKAFSGQTDMYFVSYSTDTLDAMEAFTTFYQGANYSSATIDELITQANKTLDAEMRLSLLKQIAQAGASDVALIPLYNSASTLSIYAPSYHMEVDVPGVNLGVNFYKVYAR